MIKFILCLWFGVSSFWGIAQVTITDPTLNNGKVEWEWRVQVGETAFGVPISGEFRFKNIGAEPLTLKSVDSGCKCTVTDFTKGAIPPGGEGVIKATYDAKHVGVFYKMVFIKTNFDPEHEVILAMEGKVK